MTGIATLSLAEGAEPARHLLDSAEVEAVQVLRAPLDEQPFRDFVHALLRAPGFKLDFNGQTPEAALALVSNRLLGAGAFDRERGLLVREIEALEAFATSLAPDAWPQVALRTYFAPGDLVWHADRVSERIAFRLLWPLGRPAGMLVTPAENIDGERHAAYMRREHPLLCRLDSQVLRAGGDIERLWSHRPAQVAAMTSGRFPFLRDPARTAQVDANAISIHKVETPLRPGTFHRSSWANRASPGLQIVITIVSDAA
jgi:hypothetical protein